MADPLPSKALTIALERVAEYRKTRHMIGMPYQEFMIALADEIERLQQDLARTESARAVVTDSHSWLFKEKKRLETTLTGISTCSTCEACRGAAERALGGQS